jgi:hypothetical protein
MDQERVDVWEVTEARERVVDDVRDLKTNANLVERAKGAIGNLRPTDNPMLMLFGGLAIGFLIGMILPISRFENERLGPVADDLKDRMREAGAQAARRGGEMIKESIDAATSSSVSRQTPT